MAKQYKNMTEKEFKLVKALTDAGLSASKIKSVVNRSATVVGWVRKSESFEDYKLLMRTTRSRWANGKKQPEVTYTIANTDTEIVRRLRNIEEQQAQILKYLQEQFESNKVKKFKGWL